MIGDTLKTILTSDDDITAITENIYPSTDPGTSQLMPRITYQQVTFSPGIDNDGVHIRRYQFQIDCWATSYKAAGTLAEAVVDCLQLYSTPPVQKIIVDDVHDSPVAKELGKEKATVFRKTIRVTIAI